MTEHTPFAPPTPPRRSTDESVWTTDPAAAEHPAEPAAVEHTSEPPAAEHPAEPAAAEPAAAHAAPAVEQPSDQPAEPAVATHAAPHAVAAAHAGEPRRRAPRARVGLRGVVSVALVGLLTGVAGGAGAYLVLDQADLRPADADLPVPDVEHVVDRPSGSVAAIAADVLPSVVSIEVQVGQGGATGSGLILKEDGYILTNNHVVAEAAGGAKVVVTFADGHEQEARVVGATPDYDLAVLKVEESGLVPLVLGDSDAIVVGDSVLAVGSPLGLDATVTTGIVSALHRPVKAGEEAEAAFIDAIQTDAAINPGNSGGPLVNAAGEVIGINSAIAQPPGAAAATGSIGLGFAIPSNQARHTAEQLIETGQATFPVIGVLLDPAYQGEGVRVAENTVQGQAPVTPEGPADLAGIRAGDVILAIDGRPVSQADELIVAIRAKAPGDPVTLRVRTGDDERDVRVVLSEKTSG